MGRTLVVGDVHGCADELEALLRTVRPTRTVLVGDLFTKGPDPRGVWSLVKGWDAEAVLGNHDQLVLDEWTPGDQLPKKAHKWLKRQPWQITGDDWLVVHAGVNPHDWRRTRKREALHLKQWRSGRKWWEHYWNGPLVVHGHDAKAGLVDRRPFSLGLDTACVRGGRLTGYVLEEDRLVSVPARRAYS